MNAVEPDVRDDVITETFVGVILADMGMMYGFFVDDNMQQAELDEDVYDLVKAL